MSAAARSKRVSRYFRHWPKCVAETHSLNAVRRELISPWSQSTTVKEPPCSGDSGIWGNLPRITSSFCREAVVDAASADAGMGVREYTQSLTLINSLNAASGLPSSDDNHTPSVPAAALTSGSTRSPAGLQAKQRAAIPYQVEFD